jgi:ubiquinone/menaquinone biosynthesis C-methylase UbiE
MPTITHHKRSQEDFNFLLHNAQVGKAKGLSNFLHLDQPIGIWNYIRIADDISAQLSPDAHVLDWGCGMGQMTYLMQQRGLRVTAFDVRPADDKLPDTPLSKTFEIIVTQEPTLLPFGENAFDAVLSCGVLEHVDEHTQPGNEMKSLREIHRVLKPTGKLLIYQLPQRDAWQEAVIRGFKLGYAHPRRYTATEITHMLHTTGFAVTRLQRANLIPKNLTGMPAALRQVYSRASKPLIVLDGAASQVPGLRGVAGVLEVIAQKV